MGGEVMLLMKKGEVPQVRKFLKTVLEVGDDGILWSNAPQPFKKGNGCWVELKGNRIDVGYSIGFANSAWAIAIACGIREHFHVLKGGWDSVGYCDDFMTTRPFRVDINMTERVILHGQGKLSGIHGGTHKEDLTTLKGYRKTFEKAVDKMFQPLKAQRRPKPRHTPYKEPHLDIMEITWYKDTAKQGNKIVDIEVAKIKDRLDLKERFCLLAVDAKINMWCLYDSVTKSQHYVMKEKAAGRITEILTKGNKKSK